MTSTKIDAQPLPIRSRVRAAIEEAWQRAVASGALPASADGATLPMVEISRPANDEHGDLASNLALKLARPYRRAPLDIATALGAEIERGAADPTSPIATVEVAPPGFLNLRLSDSPRPRPGAASHRSGPGGSTSSSCRPTRPGH